MSEEHLRDGIAASSLVVGGLKQEQVDTVVYTLNAAIDFFGPKEIRLRPTPTQQENGLWQVKMRCWL